MELVQLIEILKDYYTNGDVDSDYHFFMKLIDHAIVPSAPNPFGSLKPDTVERCIRNRDETNSRNRFNKSRLRKVLNAKDPKRLMVFIQESYSDEVIWDLEAKIQDQFPEFNNQGNDFAQECSSLFYELIEKYLKHSRKAKQTPSIQPQPVKHDKTDAFHKTYQKEMSLAYILPDIRSEIWKNVNEIINACQRFKQATAALFRSIDLLNAATAEADQARFFSNYPTYEQRLGEIEESFNTIMRLWGHLYTPFSHIKEIYEILQIDYSDTLLLPPGKRVVHVASAKTDAFIEKLRKLAEDYLFM